VVVVVLWLVNCFISAYCLSINGIYYVLFACYDLMQFYFQKCLLLLHVTRFLNLVHENLVLLIPSGSFLEWME